MMASSQIESEWLVAIPTAYLPEATVGPSSATKKATVLHQQWMKPSVKGGRRKGFFELTAQWLYPLLFRCYLVALHVLFILYKLLVSVGNAFFDIYISFYFAYVNHQLKKEFVIIGGGYAGTFAAMKLEDEFNVTLVDTKDYFEFTPSRLRTLVEPDKSQVIQVKHSNFLEKTRVVVQHVHHVTPEEVITETTSIPFDYLLICTGSRYTEPNFGPLRGVSKMAGSAEEAGAAATIAASTSGPPTLILSARAGQFESYNALVQNAQRILVIGGGTVGVELAAEIIENFKHKELTIVNSQPQLMNKTPLRAICYTEDFFKRHGVRVLVNERVVAHEGNVFKTLNGTILEADLAFMCTGNVPNSDFLRNSCFSDNVNRWGFVRVNDHLQLAGYQHVFVAGDITDMPGEDEKLCQTAASETRVVINNIRNLESGRPLVNYVPGKCPMLISLGKYDGVLTYGGWTMTGFVPAAMKEFVEWKELVYYWPWKRYMPSVFRKWRWSRSSSSGRTRPLREKHAHVV